MSRAEQVRAVAEGVTGRAVRATGLEPFAGLEARVDSLEVAIAENTALAEPLARLVDDLEQDVVRVLSAGREPGMGA